MIDCGTLARNAEQTAGAAATHIAWVLTATTRCVVRGGRVLEAAPRMAGKELIAARQDVRQPTAPLRQLRRIAAERQAPLVLVPHMTGGEAGRIETGIEAAQVPVQAILGALQR